MVIFRVHIMFNDLEPIRAAHYAHIDGDTAIVCLISILVAVMLPLLISAIFRLTKVVF